MTDGEHGPSLDALLPAEMALRAEEVGIRKAGMPAVRTLVLGVLAGAFVALGGLFSTTVAAGAGGWPFGVVRLLAGVVFSLGLLLVVVGGAELFTGNNLIVMAWVGRKVSTRQLLRNWLLVYVGNFVGAVGTAVLVVGAGQYMLGGGKVGVQALDIASSKLGRPFHEALLLGVLCNALVCLAVWMSLSARTTIDRAVAVVPPVAAFVATGLEHSIANMYFIPLGLLIRDFAPVRFWASANAAPTQYATLSWSAFVTENLLPVTMGNIIGGAGLVGLVYWFVYLRRTR